jgi:hypothetical protein
MPESVGRAHGAVALVAGRYELLRELNDTGDFQEWEGFDSALERVVIVRLAPHDAVPNSPAAERFWRAARVSARANATAGERVLDAGTDPDSGRAFLICEWPRVADAPSTHSPPARQSRPRFRVGRLLLPLGVVALVAAVALIGRGVAGWLSWVNAPLGAAQNTFSLPHATSATPVPTIAPSPTTVAKATAPATPGPTATPVARAGVPRRVVNTDGRGVALRDGPGGNRLPGKGYDEGATVTAFEGSGGWTHIRGSDGREGWVLSVTLAP